MTMTINRYGGLFHLNDMGELIYIPCPFFVSVIEEVSIFYPGDRVMVDSIIEYSWFPVMLYEIEEKRLFFWHFAIEGV